MVITALFFCVTVMILSQLEDDMLLRYAVSKERGIAKHPI